jgi:DNA repair protein RadA/Sms
MSKTITQFVCQQCGRTSPRPLGRCPSCGAWGSMVEEVVSQPAESVQVSSGRGLGSASKPLRMNEIAGDAEARMPLSMGEFARVLGGGIVPGSIVLVGGDPGIGKSTLMLQMASEIAARQTVLYVSGEESERQIKMRALRLSEKKDGRENSSDALYLVTETNLDILFEHVRAVKPAILIVDSIQTMYLPEMKSTAGSISQVRECASRLRELAKSSNIAVFLIGHVTKEGMIAGPRVLEHIVDTVLYLEGDRFQTYRLLRSVKNRFGATSEVGVFEMAEHGMVEVTNPSEAFLAERLVNTPGSSIAVMMEGTRPLLVEIQGLTSHTNFGNPRRTPNGLDLNRVLLIVAVLSRRMGVNLLEQDVFVNVVGGLRINEPASDLAVAAAITSSMLDIPVKADAVLIGEIGLSGELRHVSQLMARLKEASKLGFKTAIIPSRLKKSEPWPDGIQVVEARSLREAIDHALVGGLNPPASRNGMKQPIKE